MNGDVKPKILIVEDGPLIAARLGMMLEELNYPTPTIVSSGEQALDYVAREQPDLILMDIGLGGKMDGVEAAEKIWIHYEVPVIFLTGRGDKRTLQRARLAEPLGFLLKPIQRADLHSAIVIADHRRRLELRQREGQARFRISPSGQILFASAPLVEMLGYRDQESLACRNLRELCVDFPETWRASSLTAPDDLTRDVEIQLLHHNGSVLWVSASSRAVFDADEEIAYHEGRLTDITKWKRAELQLRRRAVHLESLNAIVTSTATTTTITELLESAVDNSLRALNLTAGSAWLNGAYKSQELPDDPLWARQIRLIAGEIFPKTICVADWQERSFDGSLSSLAALMTGQNFRSSLIVPIINEGRPIGGICLATSQPRPWTLDEITFLETLGHQLGAAAERLRLLETIRAQVLQVHQIIHAVPEGVILLGSDSHILMANPVGSEYLSALGDNQVGDVLTQLGGRPLSELMTSPLPGLWHQVETESRCFEIIARAVEPGPQTSGWVIVVRDITERQALQQRMQRQDRLASVGQLAAGIAHDLNNLFTVITIHAQLAMTSEGTPTEAQERIATVLKQGERGSNLIDQILDFSRQADMNRRSLALTPLINESVKLLQHTLPENIHLTCEHEMDDCVVSADPTRIQQVLMNLAINARDAMPDGGTLQIRLSRLSDASGATPPLPEMEPIEWVQIDVEDDGTGIPADILPHIFDPFFTTKEAGKGTGLGLAQVHGIIEQHEGHINVRTTEGVGTTFSIYLPAEIRVDLSPSGETSDHDLARGNGEHLLVVEDDPATLEVLVDGLKSLQYRVSHAENGRQALEIMDQKGQEIALILSDLVMPEMGGKALLHALARRGWAGPLIVLSGHPLGTSDSEGIDTDEIAAVLAKPVRLEQLASAVKKALKST
jgi:PAS domain S-box-containing protein